MRKLAALQQEEAAAAVGELRGSVWGSLHSWATPPPRPMHPRTHPPIYHHATLGMSSGDAWALRACRLIVLPAPPLSCPCCSPCPCGGGG